MWFWTAKPSEHHTVRCITIKRNFKLTFGSSQYEPKASFVSVNNDCSCTFLTATQVIKLTDIQMYAYSAKSGKYVVFMCYAQCCTKINVRFWQWRRINLPKLWYDRLNCIDYLLFSSGSPFHDCIISANSNNIVSDSLKLKQDYVSGTILAKLWQLLFGKHQK